MSRPRPAPRRASRSAVDQRAPADDESFKFKRAAALARAPDAIEALARAMPAPANAYDVPALRRLRGAASASERTEKRSAGAGRRAAAARQGRVGIVRRRHRGAPTRATTGDWLRSWTARGARRGRRTATRARDVGRRGTATRGTRGTGPRGADARRAIDGDDGDRRARRRD